jgi:translocation and assembly module TamB
MFVVDDEQTRSETHSSPLLVDITAIAGEDVQVDAYELRGNIIEKLAIKNQPGRPPIGNGTLSVRQGSFNLSMAND